MKKSRFLIITGMSGAGKSLVLKALEDMDFFCVDNLPPTLIPKFAELYQHVDGKMDKNVALVVDIRVGIFFEQLSMVLEQFEKQGFVYDLLFLDCSDEKLVNRYKETRRRHPLATEDRISNGIKLERQLLADVRNIATNIIDTTNMKNADLKQRIREMFSIASPTSSFNVLILSFGFKYGLPTDADMVFDVRFLDNPFYIEELRYKSGNEPDVAEYIMRSPATEKFLDKLYDMMEFLLPYFIKEGKAQLVVGIGCTGGMHRSVFVANRLAEHLKNKNYKVRKEHRDIRKNVKS